MPTVPYFDKAGKRLPSQSTIKGNLGWSTNPLMAWKENQIIEVAIETYKNLIEAYSLALRELVKQKSEEAPTAGTICHYLIECDLKSQEPDLTKYSEECISLAQTAFKNYQAWRESVHLDPIEIEPHLIHEDLKYGGTPDCVANVNGKPSIFDWKAGSIYEDYLVQLACYGKLWEINHPDILLTGGFHLLEIKKEDAAFTHHWWQDLSVGWEAFTHGLALHDLRKKLRKML